MRCRHGGRGSGCGNAGGGWGGFPATGCCRAVRGIGEFGGGDERGAVAADEVEMLVGGVGECGLDKGEFGFYHGEAAPVHGDSVAEDADVGLIFQAAR